MLADILLDGATILCQIDHPREGLNPAEHALRLYTVLHRGSGPKNVIYCHGLSTAWGRIGKVRWGMGDKQDAIAAFRQAAIVERLVFEATPSIAHNRLALFRAYERLAYYARQAGMRKDVADALLEMEKLCLDDKKKLGELAAAFGELAKRIGQDGKETSPSEQAERQRYLDQSERLAQVASR